MEDELIKYYYDSLFDVK